MRIDIHSHFICLDFIKHLQGRDSLPVSSFEDGTYVTTCCPGFRIPAVPRFVDMEVKLRDMEEMKVDVSVLSHVQPGSEVLPSNEADYWASRINDHLAGIIEKYPRKFLAWGCLGFGSTERTIKEIDRCISELGFAGILLYSNINGKALDSPEFRLVYKHIARLGVPIFMHPTIPLNLVGMDKGSLISGLGFMYDTSLNTVRLIQSGLFDEEPGLKLIMPHVGGVLPYLKGRLERTNEPAFRSMSYQPPLHHPFGYYLLQQLYFDTVCYHIEALEYCYHMVGGERLLYGTDHPVGQPFDLVAGMLERLQCTDEERDLIYCGNAKRLLRVK